MTYSPPLVPQTPQHKRHGVRNGCLLSFAIAAAAAVVIGVVAAALGGGGSTAGHPAATSTTTAAPVTAAPPVTDPKGKYNGSCSYNLGNNGSTYTATGDIQMHNTGNVGIVVRMKITWPQQGYAPLAMTRTVKLATGQHRDVQFHRPLSYTQISNLQSWQSGHSYADGCTYHAKITDTYGPVSG